MVFRSVDNVFGFDLCFIYGNLFIGIFMICVLYFNRKRKESKEEKERERE